MSMKQAIRLAVSTMEVAVTVYSYCAEGKYQRIEMITKDLTTTPRNYFRITEDTRKYEADTLEEAMKILFGEEE